MATARGSNAKIYIKEQTATETMATGNYIQVPVKSFGLRGSQPLSRDDLLSANVTRDGSAPYLGVISVGGDAVVPIDTTSFGYWVKGLMGTETKTGTTDITHVFTSGKTSLPDFSVEKAFPDVPAYDQYLGVKVAAMSIDLSPSGTADATISLMGLNETTATTSIAGTPTFTAGQRFMKPSGAIKKDGATLAQVVGGRLNMSNNMSGVQTIRSDNRLEEIDFGNFTAGGDLRIRFRDNSLKAQAIASTPCSLEYSFTISATKLIKFEYAGVYLSRPGVELNGPAGLELPVTWEASYDASAGYLARVTIINQIASY